MNYRKCLLVIIFVSVIFILGSYLATDSATLTLPFRWKSQRAKVWPTIQNFNWSVTDLVRGDLRKIAKSQLGTNLTNQILSQVSRQGHEIADRGNHSNNETDSPKLVSQEEPMSSKRIGVTQRDAIKRILLHMDGDLRVQYFLQAGKYESQHSKPIVQLSFPLQWDFLVKFLKAAGYHQRLPDVINIGVKKSGTNALGFFITQHPLIAHSIGNEVHFFDWNYRRGLDFYRSRMGFSSKDQLSFEKTPRYFITESAPENILRDLGNATKFIVCIRDPIKRIISEFRHERELALRKVWLKNGKKPIKTTAQSEGKKLAAALLDVKGNINASNALVRTSSYSIYLKNWLKYHPLRNFLFLNHDALIGDTFNVMTRVENFLDLHNHFERGMFYYDPVRGGPCIYKAVRPCPAKSTPGFLTKAKLSKEVELKLRDYFRPLLAELFETIGETFAWSENYR